MHATHLIDLNDFSVDQLNHIINLAIKIEQNPKEFYGVLQGRILGTLFYEPSTRTQISFQSAMLKLGGQTIGFDDPENSSVAKGENLKDTVKVISSYADIIAIRHPNEGAAKAAAVHADCPIINAGDGGHLHPTQTLTDLLTLFKLKGRTDDLTIGVCGDLKNGRTVHSLIKQLCNNNTFILISTKELTVPDYIKKIMEESGCRYQEVHSLEEAMPLLDVLYMTRIQRERFRSVEEYENQKNVFILNTDKLKNAKKDLRILHPLPRVDEITIAVDDDPRASYFSQASYGVYVRMALILAMLQDSEATKLFSGEIHQGRSCINSNCITNKEMYLQRYYQKNGDKIVCEYCDHTQ